MTQKKTYRIEQINRLLREEIAAILLMELQDESLAAVTVTGVRASRDLHNALVFITAHQSQDTAPLLDKANRRAGHIRKLLYDRLRLKRIPALEFRYDDTLDKVERIYQTLERIHREDDRETPPAGVDTQD